MMSIDQLVGRLAALEARVAKLEKLVQPIDGFSEPDLGYDHSGESDGDEPTAA